jgi:hypothetical protein
MQFEITQGGGYANVLVNSDGMRYSEDGSWKLEGGGWCDGRGKPRDWLGFVSVMNPTHRLGCP